MFSYTVIPNPLGGFPIILRSDGVTIPHDPMNPDFAAFAVWNSQQATPLDYTTIAQPPKQARIPLAYTATYAQIQTLYGATPSLALKYLMAWVAYQAVNNPIIAADINSKLGTSIGFDQPNP